jgi:hypothetical protein
MMDTTTDFLRSTSFSSKICRNHQRKNVGKKIKAKSCEGTFAEEEQEDATKSGKKFVCASRKNEKRKRETAKLLLNSSA